MPNHAPVLYMVNNNGTVFNNLSTNGSSYTKININNDPLVLKYISGKHSYYIDNKNHLYKIVNKESYFIRDKVYDITTNTSKLYIIDMNYKIRCIKHNEIQNKKKWKIIKNNKKQNLKYKTISSNDTSLWAIDNMNKVYEITKNESLFKEQDHLYLTDISADNNTIGNIYGIDIHNNLYSYDGKKWDNNSIKGTKHNIRNIAVGNRKVYGIDKDYNLSVSKGFYVDGNYITNQCNPLTGCSIENTYCNDKKYCCIKGIWQKGICDNVSAYKSEILSKKVKSIDDCINLCNDTHGCNLYNYSNTDKECYLYSSMSMNNPTIIPNDKFSNGSISYNNDGVMYYCNLPCKGEFMKSSYPSSNNISFGSINGDNNLLNAGTNTNIKPVDMTNCTLLKGVDDKSYLNTIIKSNKFIYGYQKANPLPDASLYYGCTPNTTFTKDTSSKHIVWKKSIYSFPRFNDEYIYTKEQSKDICSVYGLNQCSQAEIENRQQCACGWVSNNDNPIFWLNDVKGCKADGKNITPGFNVCTAKGQKANTYCCGDILDNKYSICPPKYPYPVTTPKLPILGGEFGGNNSFCVNTSNNEHFDEKAIRYAIKNNNAVACVKPPCVIYKSLPKGSSSSHSSSTASSPPSSSTASSPPSSSTTSSPPSSSTTPSSSTASSPPLSSTTSSGSSSSKSVSNTKSPSKSVSLETTEEDKTMWNSIEEFTNYRKENKCRIGIIWCFCIIIIILIYNFKY